MTDFNQQHNRVVWFDLPVVDLERASGFYRAVLACEVAVDSFGDAQFGVLEHSEGNGGCLVPMGKDGIAGDRGPLLYFNVEGRIRDAVSQVVEHGGEIVQDVHTIGPHGHRALVLDSEGNRVALHSMVDA